MTCKTTLAVYIAVVTGVALQAQNPSLTKTKGNACASGFVLHAPVDVEREFIASGWMGDGEKGKQYLQMLPVSTEKPRPGDDNNLVTKVHYQGGGVGWAGVYWQWPANNWGDKPPKQIEGASKVSFWAAGQKGGEIVEFKAGGITGKSCQDSFEASLGKVALARDWKRYEIPFRRSQSRLTVVGAFAWVAESDANAGGITFYIDNIRYE